MTVQLRLSRWRCRTIECRRKTFVEQMPEVFPPLGAERVVSPNSFIYLAIAPAGSQESG